MEPQHWQCVDCVEYLDRVLSYLYSHNNLRVIIVEQKGTNNNHGFPEHIAKNTDNTTDAHHDKQKSQRNILLKKSLPCTCIHSTTPHLRNRVKPKAATKATTTVKNKNAFISAVLPAFLKLISDIFSY